MFMCGAFSDVGGILESENSLAPAFNNWVSRVKKRSELAITSQSDHFLNCVGAPGEECHQAWLSHVKLDVGGERVHFQVYGHPNCFEPLISTARLFRDFDTNLEEIRRDLRKLNVEFFCVVFVESGNQVYFLTDKLGITPGYVSFSRGAIYYSTCLWALKLIDSFDDSVNWQAVAEKYVFRCPLGSRTVFSAISRQRGGYIFRHSRVEHIYNYYKIWDSLKKLDSKEVPESLAEGFRDAVSSRLLDSSADFANLSGGLDSRLVVTELARRGRRVVTVNYSAPDTLDSLLAEGYARELGINHNQHSQFALNYPNFSSLNRSFVDKFAGTGIDGSVATAFWTGDVGSLTIGLVLLRRKFLEKIINVSRADIPDFVLETGDRMPRRAIEGKAYEMLTSLARSGISDFFEELGDIRNDLKYYCFLVLNYVTRTFDQHFETAHVHRIARQMPFLDARTIEPVLSTDLPESSEHRLYLKVAERIDARILRSPWQAYPGHEPCPLPLPDARNQWQKRAKEEQDFLRKRHRQNARYIFGDKFWSGIVRPEMAVAYYLRDFFGEHSRCSWASTLREISDQSRFLG